MDGLDWKDLAEEFSFCASWSWTSSCVAFVLGFLPSFGDVFFDGVTVKKFIHGDVYTIQFFPNDSSLTEMNCTIQKSLNGTTDGEKATYECFQKDQIWGYVTLFLMFAPGLFGGPTLWEGLQDVKIGRFTLPLPRILTILTWPFFPVLLLLCKLVGLVNQGPMWKKFLLRMTAAEARWESSLSFLLLLFYIFTDGGRFLSQGVFASFLVKNMLVSLILICKAEIEGRLRIFQPMDFKEEVQRTLLLLPLYLFDQIHKLGALAIMAALLRYWFLFILAIMILLVLCGAGVHVVRNSDFTPSDFFNKEKMFTRNGCFGTLASCSVLLIGVVLLPSTVIWANVNPGASLPGLFWEGHKFSDLYLIRNITILNVSFSVVVVSTLLHKVYYIFLQKLIPQV